MMKKSITHCNKGDKMTSNFQSNIISIYGQEGEKWLQTIPDIILKLTKEFGLTDIQTEMTNIQLSFNYIFFAKYSGIDAVIKTGPSIKDSMREMRTIRHFNGNGMVKLLAHNDDSIIMERALPGSTLAKDNPNSIKIACDLMKKLHSLNPPSNPEDFTSLEELLAPIDQIPIENFINPKLLEKARIYKKELMPKYQERVLLHCDLHHDNILKNGDNYIAIDPKGVIGHPINEAWNIVIDYEKDTQFIADYFGYNLSDLRKWYFIHLILVLRIHSKVRKNRVRE
jgi:streptomycin 6-kinase